jgi:hypothetical protein
MHSHILGNPLVIRHWCIPEFKSSLLIQTRGWIEGIEEKEGERGFLLSILHQTAVSQRSHERQTAMWNLTSPIHPTFILRSYISCRCHAAYNEMTGLLYAVKIELLLHCNVLYERQLSLRNMHIYVYYCVYTIHICSFIHNVLLRRLISNFRLSDYVTFIICETATIDRHWSMSARKF